MCRRRDGLIFRQKGKGGRDEKKNREREEKRGLIKTERLPGDKKENEVLN